MEATDIAIELQVLIERYKTTQGKLLHKLVTELERAARSVLADSNLADLRYPQLFRELSLADQRVQVIAHPILRTFRNELTNFLIAQKELEIEAWQQSDSKDIDALTHIFEAPLGIDGKDKGRNIDAFLLSWWNDARDAVFGMLKLGSYQKKSNGILLDELRGTKRLSFQDGITRIISRSALTTSNTIVQHASSMLREFVMLESVDHVIMWSSLFERNTCVRCGGRDGQIFEIGEGGRSPLHHNCRCFMIPILRGTETDYQFTYYKWLQRQPKEFIEEALGQTRATLFLSGTISAERFIALQYDKKFDPINLIELRKIGAGIFAKAGL